MGIKEIVNLMQESNELKFQYRNRTPGTQSVSTGIGLSGLWKEAPRKRWNLRWNLRWDFPLQFGTN